jgi:hypothetical protein
LIGRNGIGKTTLLRHLAAYAVEGMPKHLKILHVEQEVWDALHPVPLLANVLAPWGNRRPGLGFRCWRQCCTRISSWKRLKTKRPN